MGVDRGGDEPFDSSFEGEPGSQRANGIGGGMDSNSGKPHADDLTESLLHSQRDEALLVADEFEHFVDYLLRGELPPVLKLDLERSGDLGSYRVTHSFEVWRADNLEVIEHMLRALEMFRQWENALNSEDIAYMCHMCRDIERDFADSLLATD